MNDVARTLAGLVRGVETGILALTRGKHRRLLCLERGALTLLASNVIEEQPEDRLVSDGLIDHAALVRAQVEGRALQKKPVAAMVDLGLADVDAVRGSLTSRLQELVLDSLTWTDAEMRFDRGRPNLAGEFLLRVNPLPWIYRHALTHPGSIDDVRIAIGPPDGRPRPTDDGAAWIPLLEAGDEGTRILERLDGRRDIGTLLQEAEHERDDPDAVLRHLYALVVTGVVDLDAPGARAAKEDRDAVSRREVESRIARALDATHYDVLGLATDAAPEAIREAYYYLARRYHPDRFRSGEMQDLLGAIEQFFSQVTQAYNTLSAPDLRAQYDEELAEGIGRGQREPAQDASYLARENFARGKVLAEKKQYQDAVRFLENAIELDGNKSEYHLELGRVLALNPRRRTEAEPHLRRAIELEPARVEGYIALGDLLRKTGRKEGALATYREALNWEPGHVEAGVAVEELKAEVGGASRRKGLFGG